MPVLTELQCDTIIHYLQTEALKDAVIKGPLIDDVVDLLNDNGFTIPTSSRGKVLLGTSGNTQRYAQISTMKQSLSDANNIAIQLGFTDLIECNNYTRNIQVTGKATTGTQKTSKVTPAGNTPPSRALNATFFDHNGQMAANILSIASSGSPTGSWVASAKKVAAGTNYTTEFPVSVGPSYVIGDRGINQMLTGTATSTPANPVQPAPVTPSPPAPTPVEETQETPEVVEEVVVEEPAIILGEGESAMQEKLTPKVQKAYTNANKDNRRLSIPKWEERDKTSSGMYPYPLKEQPIYFLLQPAAEDGALQFSEFLVDPENWDADPNTPARLSDQGVIIVQSGMKLKFTTMANLLGSGGEQKAENLSSDNIADFTLKWSRPGSANKIELFEAKNKNGATIFKVIDGTITEIASNNAILATQTSGLMTANQSVELSQTVLQIITQHTEDSGLTASDLGYPQNGDAWTENIPNWTEANPAAQIFFYSVETTPVATVDVYEQEMTDLDGSTILADELLARVAGTADQSVDVQNKYIKVFLDFDYAGARTTDLFSGRIQDSESRLSALIFPGDQIDLDIEGINAELGLVDQLDKVMALKSVQTSALVPALDSDGNALGYDTCSDATLTFEHKGKTKVIQIPNADGEVMAFDRNGQEVKGQVDSIEVHSGNAAAMYETQKMIRRSNRMAPSFNLPNPSATDQNATASVAFRIGRKYYVIGRREGQPVLIELDLNYQQEAQ
ncbi:MAG: hypothetical protein ACTSPB_02610 [Candidatus Thorarchaeota archaeon]